MDDASVRLADGRLLAFRSWGAVGGPLVMAFHGSPGSRVWWPGEEHTRRVGVHLVTIDRPGYGRSDPLPGRGLLGWADDVIEMAAHLEAARFGVVGWSGGAPYAAAVAATLPDRLTGVCLVSSASLTFGLDRPSLDEEDQAVVDSVNRYGWHGATLRLAEEEQGWADRVLHDPRSVVEGGLGEADRMLLHRDPVVATGLADSFREAVRQGSIGVATDWVAHVLPWGFSLRDIEIPVHLWHGAQDAGVTTDQVTTLAAMIPEGQLTVWPEGGHLGITQDWPDVLAACLPGG